MKKIIEYKVAGSENLDTFTALVNALIKEGWQPNGEMHVVILNNGMPYFCQSLVLFENH